MSTTDWDPFEELARVHRRMNRLFEAALSRTGFGEDSVGVWTPAADVAESPEAVRVRLDLPGLRRENLDLTVSGNELVVGGDRPVEREQDGERYHRVERSYGRFSRRFTLPADADGSAIRATYRDGVLEVEIPKSASGTRTARTVPVRVG